MLKPYRRHNKDCKHTSATDRRCQCPIWVDGSIDGRRVRRSLDTRNWRHAEELIIKMLGEDHVPEKLTVAVACRRFMEDCRSRNLAKETVAKYDLLCREMTKAWGSFGIKAVLLDDVAKYRESWNMGALASKKKIERMWAFFNFCLVRGWVRMNPVVGIKKPIVRPNPTLPFSDEEVEKILWATEVYPIKGIYGEGNRLRIRAFVLLLLNTGLRIQDAVTLRYDRIQDGRLLLYTQKTGTPVHIPLPDEVVEALGKVPAASVEWPFWSGTGDPKSSVKDWQRTLRKLFTLATIENGHAHRFRDTFSIRLLNKGVSIEHVAALLGNTVQICQKHYAPWIQERQQILEAAVKRTWA